MTKYKGGEVAKAGFYWNRGSWGVELVPADGGVLPGAETIAYVRVPWPLLLVIAPAMGGAFAMFLPFIGIALLGQFAWAAITGRRVSHHAEERI